MSLNMHQKRAFEGNPVSRLDGFRCYLIAISACGLLRPYVLRTIGVFKRDKVRMTSICICIRCLRSVGLTLAPEELRLMAKMTDTYGDGLIPTVPVLEFLREEARTLSRPGRDLFPKVQSRHPRSSY